MSTYWAPFTFWSWLKRSIPTGWCSHRLVLLTKDHLSGGVKSISPFEEKKHFFFLGFMTINYFDWVINKLHWLIEFVWRFNLCKIRILYPMIVYLGHSRCKKNGGVNFRQKSFRNFLEKTFWLLKKKKVENFQVLKLKLAPFFFCKKISD